MIPYNHNYKIDRFGLYNSGSLCYLNALIQSLVSLPSFVKSLYAYEDEFSEADNSLGLRLLRLCKAFDSGPDFMNRTDNGTFTQAILADVSGILSEIQSIRKKSGKVDNLHLNTQEDVFEGFKFLIESLDETNTIDGEVFLNIFAIRHRLMIHCECGKKHTADRSSAPAEIMMNMSDQSPLLQKDLNSQEMIEQYIKMNMLYPDDYRCETCNRKNNLSKNIHPIRQIYTLARISSVIVFCVSHNHKVLLENAFAKRGQPKKERTVAWFPQELTFLDNKRNLLHYKVIAQIEQFGNLTSGHYIAKCLRPRPPGHARNRLNTAKKNLKDLYQRIRVAKEIGNTSRIKTLENTAFKMVSIIKEEEKCLSSNNPWDKMGVFQFDDGKITYIPEGFKPSKFTYLVFYHLV